MDVVLLFGGRTLTFSTQGGAETGVDVDAEAGGVFRGCALLVLAVAFLCDADWFMAAFSTLSISSKNAWSRSSSNSNSSSRTIGTGVTLLPGCLTVPDEEERGGGGGAWKESSSTASIEESSSTIGSPRTGDITRRSCCRVVCCVRPCSCLSVDGPADGARGPAKKRDSTMVFDDEGSVEGVAAVALSTYVASFSSKSIISCSCTGGVRC